MSYSLHDLLKYHPSLQFADDMRTICQPLSKLGVDYFSHARIDDNKQFTCNVNHPDFLCHYFNEGFQYADLHVADLAISQRYVLWDVLERKGRAEDLYLSVRQFNLAHTFTICEQIGTEKHYYHFAARADKEHMREFYFRFLDLFEQFVSWYKYSISLNDRLNRAYNMPCVIDSKSGDYSLNVPYLSPATIKDYLDSTKPAMHCSNSDASRELPRRELQCALYLLEGKTAKEMASILNLSPRTVEAYLIRLKKRFECKNVVQLIRCLIESGLVQ